MSENSKGGNALSSRRTANGRTVPAGCWSESIEYGRLDHIGRRILRGTKDCGPLSLRAGRIAPGDKLILRTLCPQPSIKYSGSEADDGGGSVSGIMPAATIEPAEADQFGDALGRDGHSQHDRPKPAHRGQERGIGRPCVVGKRDRRLPAWQKRARFARAIP